MFVSSYSPLALILLIKDFDSSTKRLSNPWPAIVGLAVALLSIVILFLALHFIRDGFHVTVRKVSNRSNELVNYSIPYMISFFGFDLGSYKEVLSFLIFMVLMCFLTIRTQSLYINPILAMAGFGLYDVEFEENGELKTAILLAKRELKRNSVCTIQRITSFMFLDTTPASPTHL